MNNRELRTGVAVGVLLLLLSPAAVNAQTSHRSRIIRSFTEPFRKSTAASAVTGIVAETAVQEGDRVQVGDPLATINRNVLNAALQIAKARAESTARLDAATSRWELQKSQLKALEDLIEGGHTNRYELEQKQSEYQNAFAEFRAAQDDITLARLEVRKIDAELNDRIIRSPIDGYVTEIHKQLGENLSQTEPQFATIVQIEKLKVRFYLDAATLKQYRIGDRVLVLVGDKKQRRQAVVSFVSPVIDSDSGLGRLEVTIDNNDLSLQSGVVAYWDESQATEPSKLPIVSLPQLNVSKTAESSAWKGGRNQGQKQPTGGSLSVPEPKSNTTPPPTLRVVPALIVPAERTFGPSEQSVRLPAEKRGSSKPAAAGKAIEQPSPKKLKQVSGTVIRQAVATNTRAAKRTAAKKQTASTPRILFFAGKSLASEKSERSHAK